MSVQIAEAGEDAVLTIETREFVAGVVAELRPVLETVVADSRGDLYVNLAPVALIDSSAIGFLAYASKRLREKQRSLVLVGPTGQPLQLLAWLRLDRAIEMRADLPEGLRRAALLSSRVDRAA